jgi:hypothetical protein
MSVPKIWVVVMLLVASTAASAQQTDTSPNPGSEPVAYKPGQVWKYHTRPGEEDSTITILKVESLPKIGTVVHVRVENLPAPNCGSFHLTRAIEHIAFTEQMLRKSTTSLAQENVALPDSYYGAYKEWAANKKHEVVKVPVSEAVGKSNELAPMICNFRSS